MSVREQVMKTLILDNYDSFTYNLYQQVARISGCEPTVVANNQISLKEIKKRSFDAIIISPGPGRPDRDADFGVCSEVLLGLDLPILGVCLGFQGLGYYCGAKLVHAQELMHGRLSEVIYKATPLFDGIPQKFKVVRYHSLVISKDLPDNLEALAWTTDGVLMAMRHKCKPHWGVQFHPESIGTECGDVLIKNFLDICEKYHCSRGVTLAATSNITKSKLSVFNHRSISSNEIPGKKTNWELHYRKLEYLLDSESVFLTLYADKEYAFWLGSDLVEKKLSRFIYIGAADGPYGEVITYRTDGKDLSVNTGADIRYYHESIFDYLKRALHDKYCINNALPFDFNCGFAGYFGYELLAECGGKNTHRSKHPDASFIFADRLIVFDQVDQKTYLV